jgi:hypothetical protein
MRQTIAANCRPPPLGMDEQQPGMVLRSHYTKRYRPNRDWPDLVDAASPPASYPFVPLFDPRMGRSSTPMETRADGNGNRLRRFTDVAVLALGGEELGPRINLGMLLDERPPLAFSHAPQTPNSIWLSGASARHSVMTGQCRQMTAAFLCAAPRTNNSSGSVERHRALDTHAMRASAAELMNNVIWTLLLAWAGGD